MNIRANSSGKVLVTFLIIFVVLSLSLAGLAMFFLHQEKEHREQNEVALKKSLDNAADLDFKLQEAIKQGALLQEKNKEVDDKINVLLDEVELQKGIAEELKKENQSFKDQLAEAIKVKEDLQAQIASNEKATQKLPELQSQLQTAQSALQKLEKKASDYEERNRVLEESLAKFQQTAPVVSGETVPEVSGEQPQLPVEQMQPAVEKPTPSTKKVPTPVEAINNSVQLENIIISPAKNLGGRILTVDNENEFVIINLGANHGIKEGQVLSVSRGKNHLGDIKVTRVQPEMCAADFIQPLSSREVRKDDQVSL